MLAQLRITIEQRAFMAFESTLVASFVALVALMVCSALYGIHSLDQALNTNGSGVESAHADALMPQRMQSRFKTQVQEWKNTLLRGLDPKQLDKVRGASGRVVAEVQQSNDALLTTLPAGEGRQAVERFRAAGFVAAAGDTAVKGQDRAPSDLLDAAGRVVFSWRVRRQRGAEQVMAKAEAADRQSMTETPDEWNAC